MENSQFMNKTLLFKKGRIFDNLAVKSWKMAPKNITMVPNTYFLKVTLKFTVIFCIIDF